MNDRHRHKYEPIDMHTCDEIDALTERAEKAEAEVAALRDEVNLIELSCGDWKKRALAAEAQVQAVREFCAATNPIRGELHMAALHGWDTAMEMVLQLLESGEIKGFAFRIANLEGRVDD